MNFIIGLLLLALALASIAVKRAYDSIPVKELKKRARQGDQVALMLHRAAAYEYSLNLILWIVVVLSTATFFVYVARSTEAWPAAFICALVLWFGFIWLPKRRASSLGLTVAAKLSPVLEKVASVAHPLVQSSIRRIRSLFPLHVHSGLYDKQDLVKLLEQQSKQEDNQIPQSSLEIAKHAIQFGDQLVRDRLVPRRIVTSVKEGDSTGPVLMSELHDSGHSRFPVFSDEEPEKAVGVLYLRDLISAKSASKVSSKMRKEVFYIHEDQLLEEALQAILKTHQHLFIVVNSFEEYVGILTIEDVLESILGEQIIDEFDQYDDLRAVAAKAAGEEHRKLEHPAEKM